MTTTTTTIDHRSTMTPANGPSRAVAWTGVAFVVCFIAGVVSSSPPDKNASDHAWIANYTGNANKLHHTITGIFLVLAGLCLAAFLTGLWRRVAVVRDGRISPLPLVAAGVAAAAMAVGGVVMGGVAQVVTNDHSAGLAELFRVSNGLGFALVALGAMPAAALSVVCLSAQGRAAGVLSGRVAVFGYVAAVALLAALAFVPVVLLLVWVLVVAVGWLRSGPAT
jgi:hypothetical protein